MSTPIRVLLAKPTHDCHDRGVRYLARKLSDAGFEVVFMNFLLPAEVIDTAVEEDVQAIGISSSSGGHMPVFEALVGATRGGPLDDVVLIGGGVIPPRDVQTLRSWGVAGIFGPGSTAEDAIDLLRRTARSGRLT